MDTKSGRGLYRASLRLIKFEDALSYDTVCFHCQQCIEKYLKALLVLKGIEFQKKHDLTYLLNLLLSSEPTLEFIRNELDALNDYAIDIRYPGDFAMKDEAKTAIRYMKIARKIIREKLGLSKRKKSKKKHKTE